MFTAAVLFGGSASIFARRVRICPAIDSISIQAANNYASCLIRLERFKEAKTLVRRTVPVARRVLGEGHRLTLKMRKIYAKALLLDKGATLDDFREAVTTFEEIERTARRVLGSVHPLTKELEGNVQDARAVLRAREMPSPRE